jgi:hypothetical protein
MDTRSVISDQEAHEEAGWSGVRQHLRQVFATDEVDVVDPEIRRDHVVARGAMWPLPLDPEWRTTTKTVDRVQEGAPVLECCTERAVMSAALADFHESVPNLGADVGELGRRECECDVEVRSQHPECGRDFGDFCETGWHLSLGKVA